MSSVNKKGGVEIDEYISRCMSNLSLDLETRKIDFLYRNDVEKGTCLYIDEEKIKRVFYNVIGNAYKYIDKDLGMIFLHIEDAGKMVWVRITDNGSGIEKDELPLILNVFTEPTVPEIQKPEEPDLVLRLPKR